MSHSAQGILLITAMYVFGVIGLFGITLFPLRAVSLFRRNISLWAASRAGKWLLVSMLFVSVLLFCLCVDATVDVSRCLLGYHCGANRASGWLNLTSIGIWYSLFEILSLPFGFLSRKVAGVAT